MTLAGFDRRDFSMLLNLFRMSLSDRFLGSALGLVWAVLSPLLLLGIFCFVFTFVFPSRLAGREGSLPFVIWLISGYGPWLALNEGLNSATVSVIGNAGIVKNIVFKSELLPMVGSLLGLVPLVVSFALILVLQITAGELPNIAWLSLPFVIVLQFVFVSGIGLFLGALNVFVRDTALVLPNLLTLILFASPIFSSALRLSGGGAENPGVQSILRRGGRLSRADPQRYTAALVDGGLLRTAVWRSVYRRVVVVPPAQIVL